MKLTKKKVFVSALAICLIAIISMGTLAWFSDSDSVTNNFYVADSDDDTADKIFSVDVWENTPDGDEDQDGFEYDDILPGDVLKKEPHVENTGHYDQYIRVIVTISDAQTWINALGADFNAANLFVGFDATMWDAAHTWNNVSEATDITALTEIVYVLYYNDVLESGDDFTVFTDVKIPESLTQDQAATFGADGFSINVKAQAVQTDNVGASAYEAFQTVGMAIAD